MNKNKDSLNVNCRELNEVRPTIDNTIKKKDKTTFQLRLASISKKLNLCLLINYK